MLRYKKFYKSNPKLCNFVTFSFFALALILLWTALTKDKETAVPSALLILLILICAIVTIITIFKHFYKNYTTRQGAVWDADAGRFNVAAVFRDLINTAVISYILLLFFYIVMLIYMMICNPQIPINQSIITEIGGLTESIRKDGLTGAAYILNLAVEAFMSLSMAAMACIISGSRSFKQFRILVAILFIIALFMGESVVSNLVMTLLVDLFGGISAIYEAVPVLAAFLLLVMETLLYAILSAFNLIMIYKLIKQKDEQIEKLS